MQMPTQFIPAYKKINESVSEKSLDDQYGDEEEMNATKSVIEPMVS
jgi:hypothetical protein